MTRRLKRPPTTPGEILREEFLTPLGITQKQLADHIGCDVKVINRVVNARTRVGVSLAVRLASALHTTPEFWLNAQRAVDLFAESAAARSAAAASMISDSDTLAAALTQCAPGASGLRLS